MENSAGLLSLPTTQQRYWRYHFQLLVSWISVPHVFFFGIVVVVVSITHDDLWTHEPHNMNNIGSILSNNVYFHCYKVCSSASNTQDYGEKLVWDS